MENRKLFSSLLELDPERRISTEEARGGPFLPETDLTPFGGCLVRR
jgi:hypothetical protein